MKITLRVEGLGHVPSMKNKKMMTRGRLITDPKRQKWMERCIRSFESSLLSQSLTTVGETSTGTCQHYSIVWLSHFDDSVQWLKEIHVKAIKVPRGREGALIELESL